MNAIKMVKRFLKKFDVFGVNFAFKYKQEEKYKTSLGGFIFLVFCVVVAVVGIYYFIPFMNRKNFSMVYYSMNLQGAEEINFHESKAAFGVGFACSVDEDGTTVDDILDFTLNYVIYLKNKDGSRSKERTVLTTHPCNYEDFYNNFNDSLDVIGMSDFMCLDKKDDVIAGIYTDEVFSYYEFSVTSKEDSVTNFNRIDKYLTSNDCRLELYYTDITIDLNDYKEPIKPYINSIFIQLNPTLFLKMNAYFMNQYFQNDDYLIFNFDEEDPLVQILYSRYEEYSLYKGTNRGVTKPTDYINYAKMYIRADTKKTEIKRKYQKFMEFYADSSSLLIALFEILFIILQFINTFYAEHSVTKNVFLFKELENKHFDAYQKHIEIKKLLSLTELFIDRREKDKNEQRKDTEYQKGLENENVKIYHRKKEIRLKLQDKEEPLSTEKKLDGNVETKPIRNKNTRVQKMNAYLRRRDRSEDMNNIITNRINPTRNDMPSRVRLNLRNNIIGARNIVPNKMEEFTLDRTKLKLSSSFNIFEIIVSNFCRPCMPKNLALRSSLNVKSVDILYKELDIALHVRNMILLDIMNRIILEDQKRDISKFISRPLLSLYNDDEKYFNDLNINFCEQDFNNFYDNATEIIQRPQKTKIETKLVSIFHEKLNNLL